MSEVCHFPWPGALVRSTVYQPCAWNTVCQSLFGTLQGRGHCFGKILSIWREPGWHEQHRRTSILEPGYLNIYTLIDTSESLVSHLTDATQAPHAFYTYGWIPTRITIVLSEIQSHSFIVVALTGDWIFSQRWPYYPHTRVIWPHFVHFAPDEEKSDISAVIPWNVPIT